LTLEVAREVLDRLLGRGCSAVEVYVKRGRSRRFELECGDAPAGVPRSTETTIAAEEAGWAVRADAFGSSFFFAASGPPRPLDAWPAGESGAALDLPRPAAIDGWREPPDIAESLIGEDEGWRALRQVAADVMRRLPRATLSMLLEDGSSEIHIANHHGIDVAHRGRVASLRLEARAPVEGAATLITLNLAERAARRLPFAGLADRVVDQLAVRAPGSIGGDAGGDMVVAPEVAARLLAPIASLFVNRPREAVAAALAVDEGGAVGPAAVTIVDDGRDARGLLPAPVDGEGLPNGARLLVDRGRLGETVLPWERSGVLLGSRHRAGWRDLPRVSLSQCFLAPNDAVSPGSLVEDLADGFYLLDASGFGSYDLAGGFFSLPVWGFRIRNGRPLHPLGDVSLVGDPRRLLDAVSGVARDLRFVPMGALYGAPTLLLRGFSLRQD
jgi:predicted Zn-dependent protease